MTTGGQRSTRRLPPHAMRCVVGGLLGVAALVASAAPVLADAYPSGNQQPAQVLGETFFRSPTPGAALSAAGGGGSGSVAFTGLNVILLLAIAVAAIALGVLLRRASGRRASTTR